MPLTELSSFARLDEFAPASFLDWIYVPGRGVCQEVHICDFEYAPLASWLHAHCCRSNRSAAPREEAAKQSVVNGGWCDRCGHMAGYFLTMCFTPCWEPSGAEGNFGRWHKAASAVSFGISADGRDCFLIPIAPGCPAYPLTADG
jgi:hypothetical protein